jgi:esterase/lipase
VGSGALSIGTTRFTVRGSVRNDKVCVLIHGFTQAQGSVAVLAKELVDLQYCVITFGLFALAMTYDVLIKCFFF